MPNIQSGSSHITLTTMSIHCWEHAKFNVYFPRCIYIWIHIPISDQEQQVRNIIVEAQTLFWKQTRLQLQVLSCKLPTQIAFQGLFLHIKSGRGGLLTPLQVNKQITWKFSCTKSTHTPPASPRQTY